jgi:hypothetical protein
MSANETFLEKFIDNIGTIPLEIRRNLAHMRSLDENYLSLHQHLRDSEEEYLKRAHDIISVLPVQSRKKNKATEDHARHDGGNCSTAGGDIDGVDASIRMNSANDGNLSTSESSSSQDSERNEWIKHKEGIIVKIPSLPVTENENEKMNTSSAAEAESGSIATSDEDKEHAKKCATNSQGIDIDINTDTDNTKSKTMLVVPTTEELRQQIQDPYALLQIAILRRNARELVEEKSSNANQTYTIIDDIIKRLDDDIEQFETLLRTTGQYVSETAVVGTGGPQPNDLAAIQVTPNSPDWILAKVMSHDEETGVYNLSDEDIESSKSKFERVVASEIDESTSCFLSIGNSDDG